MTDDQAPEPTDGVVPKWVGMPDGLPCFIGDIDGIVPWARAQGYVRFYILGGTVKTKSRIKQAGVEKEVDIPSQARLFRVTCNMLGHVIDEVNEAEPVKLLEYRSAAWFELPKIPWEMVQKMDQFFRAAYDKHRTEAIVILTYDPRKNNPDGSYSRDGWGLLVPEQSNTAGHCKYEPQSIIDEKDDEVIIVGTAHSHPAMSAFASNIDHEDQNDNDGIHITFGWTAGSDFSDVHVELQMAGSAYILSVDKAFEQAPLPPPSPDLEEMVGKVSQAKPPGAGTHSTPYGFSPYAGPSTVYTTRTPGKHYTHEGTSYDLPEGCPDPDKVTVVARLLSVNGAGRCPVCDVPFRHEALSRRRCWSCFSFFLLPAETVDDIIALRMKRTDAPVKELMAEKAERPVHIWEREADSAGEVRTSVTVHCTGTVDQGKVVAP